MSRLLLAIALSTFLTACTAAPAPPGSTTAPTPTPSPLLPTPAPSPSATPAIALPSAGITGWVQVADAEPSAGPVAACPNVKLSVEGAVLVLTQPDACGGPYGRATGEIHGDSIQLTGVEGASSTALAYALTYDPTTQHFAGTRNGTPIWIAPSKTACAPPDCATTVDGQIFDSLQRPLASATVQAVSEEPFAPYRASATTTAQGWYTLNVPPGVILSITASKAGYRGRYRTLRALPLSAGKQNRLNFGGVSDASDPQAADFGLEPIATASGS